MKQTLSWDEVRRGIWNVYDHQFSWEAAGALADYYDDLEQDIGEEIEFDAVAIACDWREYGSAEELIDDYRYLCPEEDTPDDWTEEDVLLALLECLRDNTDVLEFSGGWLVRAF